ncbi:MAG: elongation factor P [Patescibacteria group bacterium]
MLSYTDVTKGVIFVMDGEPYLVLDYEFLRMQQRRPTSKVKVKNLITGKFGEHTFQQSDAFEEAKIDKKSLNYLYNHRDEYWFADPKDPKIRIKFTAEQIGDKIKFLKPNIQVTAYVFSAKGGSASSGKGEIINIELPIKIDYKVKEAPPSFKGDTATGGSKVVVLENGLEINVPMFINQDDIIRVNTDTGQYVERAEKK